MRILVLEDETDIRESVARYLTASGFAVDQCTNSRQVLGLIAEYTFDAFILDVRLPSNPNAGFELLEQIRAVGVQTPALFLTARDTLADRLKGFTIGGDDYLVKPFALAELMARVQALLRRTRSQPDLVFERNGLRLEWLSRRVFYEDTEIKLTAKEYAILEVLCQHPGRVYSRSEIADRVWGAEFNAESNVVDVYIRNLRRKLGEWVIETAHGSGYRFPV